MSLLLPLAILACMVALAGLLTMRREARAVPVAERADVLGRIARHTARWQVAGVVAGLLGAAAVARLGGLGRGLLLPAPAFGLCVLAGVLVGEATAVRLVGTPTRGAAIETRRIGDYLPAWLGRTVAAMAGLLGLLLATASASATADDLGR